MGLISGDWKETGFSTDRKHSRTASRQVDKEIQSKEGTGKSLATAKVARDFLYGKRTNSTLLSAGQGLREWPALPPGNLHRNPLPLLYTLIRLFNCVRDRKSYVADISTTLTLFVRFFDACSNSSAVHFLFPILPYYPGCGFSKIRLLSGIL